MSENKGWIKARASDSNGSCVEMRGVPNGVQVRDTKDNGAGPILGFTKEEFAAWIDGAKKGEFDDLI